MLLPRMHGARVGTSVMGECLMRLPVLALGYTAVNFHPHLPDAFLGAVDSVDKLSIIREHQEPTATMGNDMWI